MFPGVSGPSMISISCLMSPNARTFFSAPCYIPLEQQLLDVYWAFLDTAAFIGLESVILCTMAHCVLVMEATSHSGARPPSPPIYNRECTYSTPISPLAYSTCKRGWSPLFLVSCQSLGCQRRHHPFPTESLANWEALGSTE